MTNTGIIGLVLIIANILFSYRGFSNSTFYNKYKFEVDRVKVHKEYYRLVTSGFLHVGWLHLILNMFSLYAFSGTVESSLGGFRFLVIYFAGLAGGNLLSLFMYRNNSGYTSVGASGAVCGVIFASIALFPGIGIGFFGLPFSIPAWVYGIAFVLYAIYGVRSKKDNVGHEAHLGGALIGMVIALIMVPAAMIYNYIPVLIILVPVLVFIYVIVTRPHILLVDNLYYKKNKNHYSIDHRYNEERFNQQQEIDRILDKISKKGMSSLSKKEKEMLEQYSKR